MAEPKYIETDDGFALLTTSTSSGGGASEVEVTNFPATQTVSGSVSVDNFPSTQAVTGPVTEDQLTAVVGLLSAGAYSDDTGVGDGSGIGLLKGIYVQNVQSIALLTKIETNTNSGA